MIIRLYLLAILAFLVLDCAHAATYRFTNSDPGGDAWSSANNWTPAGGPPAAEDIATFNWQGETGTLYGNGGTITSLRLGDNVPGGLTIADGGMLAVNSGSWNAVGYNNSGRLTIDEGGFLICDNLTAVGMFDKNAAHRMELFLDGYLEVNALFVLGLYFNGLDKDDSPIDALMATAVINGLLNVEQLQIDESNSQINLRRGTIIINGDQTGEVASWDDDGRLVAYGGQGTLVYDYDVTNSGRTTITALPPAETPPSITVSATAFPSMIKAPQAAVTYTLTIENNGTETATCTSLVDDTFGAISGQGDCSLPQQLEPEESYRCSFNQTIAGTTGSSHSNTVTGTAEAGNGSTASESDTVVVLIADPALPTGSIGNLVWNDLNGDGLQTPDEPGIGGLEVMLLQDNGNGYTTIATTKTAADGHYQFTGLSPGSYRVTPSTDSASLGPLLHTGGGMPHNLTLVDDQHYQAADFGFSQPAITVLTTVDQSVVTAPSASVVYSVTLQNSGPAPVVPIQILDNRFGDLSLNGCSLPPILSSGDNYTCSFTETITGRAGDTHTNTTMALARDEDQNPVFGADSTGVAFIDASKGGIGHYVWHDLDGDGIHDTGEPFFDQVTLELKLDGVSVETTKTTNGGYYSFNDLEPGSYTVTVTDTDNVLEQYVPTTVNQPYSIILASGEIDLQANFGYAKAEIDLTCTADPTAITAPGEDVTFTVVLTNSGSIDLKPTALNNSRFGDLTLKGCSLPPTLAGGASYSCTFTENISGSGGTAHTSITTLTAKDDNGHGLVASDSESITLISNNGGGLIGSQVWYDNNGDGVRNSGEPGIDGITLDLIQEDNIIATTTTAGGGHYHFIVDNGTYQVLVTDTADILVQAGLTGTADLHTGIAINNTVYLGANFGYAPFQGKPYPSLDLEKAVNGQDADLAPGPSIKQGGDVNWTYVVTNTGNVDLADVRVTDDRVDDTSISCSGDGDSDNRIYILPAGSSATCSAAGTAKKGKHESTGSATGIPSIGPVIGDTDPSHYVVTSFPWHLILPILAPDVAPDHKSVPDFCYLVADGDNFDSTDSALLKYSFSNDALELLGHLGVDDIEAMALSSDGKTMYAVDNDVLGIIEEAADQGPVFRPLNPSGVGIGQGEVGAIVIADIDGLSFDSTAGILYGSVLTEETGFTTMSLLIQINPDNGRLIKDGFGPGRDYLPIDTAIVNGNTVDGIAIDAQGRLFGIISISGGGEGDYLVEIDKLTGEVRDYKPLDDQGDPVHDMEGLAFHSSGTFYGTTGIEFAWEGTANTLYRIDRATTSAEKITRLDRDFDGLIPSDFETISCFPVHR